ITLVNPAAGEIAVGPHSTITLSVDRDALDPGWYEDVVVLEASGAGYQLDVPIRMRVPAFLLEPDLIEFGAIDTATSQILNVRNVNDDTIVWSAATALDAPWLSVDAVGPQETPQDGVSAVSVTANPEGVAPGDYEGLITITQGTDEGAVRVTMTVPAPPRLTVSPTTLNFGSVGTDKLVAIWNSGIGAVDWAIDAGAFPGWLTVSHSEGVVPDAQNATHAVLVSVNRRGLPSPSSHQHNILVTATDQDGNVLAPRTIRVSMTVAAAPVLTVAADPPRWDANANPLLDLGTEIATGLFTIANTGTGSLNWTVDPSEFPAWLSMRPPHQGSLTAADAPAQLAIEVDRTGLSSGNHSHEIVVDSNGGVATLRIVITVPAPILSASPAMLDFGEDSTSNTLTITNSGGDRLMWTVTIPNDTAWLAFDTLEGSALAGSHNLIRVTVNRASLPPGEYAATVLIASNGGNIDYTVAMSVPGPRILVTPSPLIFGPLETRKPLTVRNLGDTAQTLVWSIDNGYPHWLSFDMEQNVTTTDPNVVQVSVNRRGLSESGYEGRIRFSSNGGDATVNVTLEVPPFDLLPSALELGSRDNAGTIQVENHGNTPLEWAATVEWAQWTTPAVLDWFELATSPSVLDSLSRGSLTLTVLTRAGLEAGWQEGPVTVRNTATGYEQTLSVRIRVPGFSIEEPRTIDLGVLTDPAAAAFAITNNGDAPLPWTATVSPGAPWLTLNTYAGEVEHVENVTLSADPTGLDPGDYQGEIDVVSGEDSDTVVVAITVPAPPTLAAAPQGMDFGAISTQKLLAIWNAGIGEVTWSIDADEFEPWLSVTGPTTSTVSGEQTDSVTLRINRDGLAPARYTHSFDITAQDGDGNPLTPVTISVAMTVVGVPAIEVNTGYVDQFGRPYMNFGTDLIEATVEIRNTGTGPLIWSISTTGAPPWLTAISPSQGTIVPGNRQRVTVSINRTGQDFGGYDHTISISSNDLLNRFVEVNIQMQVSRQPRIGVSTSSVQITQYENSAAIAVANLGDPASTLDFVISGNTNWLYFYPATGRSIGTALTLKDWQEVSLSIDRSKLDPGSTASTARLDIHAFRIDAEGRRVLLDDTVPPQSLTVSVVAAPLSIEVAAAYTRRPSILRFPMLLRNVRYRALPLPEAQLESFAPGFTVFEKDVPLELTETNQFLSSGSQLRTNVVILLDYSGSMYEAAQDIDEDPAFTAYEATHPGRPLDKLQALYEYYIGNLITELPDNYRVAILEFHDRSYSILPRPHVVYRFTSNKATLLAQLQSLEIEDHGATELLPELNSAAEFLANADFPYVPWEQPEQSAYYSVFDSAEVSALICISDGRLTTPPGKVKDTLDYLADRRVRLFAIGWGRDVNHEPLTRIATGTGGHYYPTAMKIGLDDEGQPLVDESGNIVLTPTTEELADYCFTEADACDLSIARDLQAQIVFSYISLNEEPSVRTRISVALDDPNDDFGECGINDMGTIFADFEQRIDFSAFYGDVRLGQISMLTDGIQPDDTAQLHVRTDYIPRNIHEFQFELSSQRPFTLTRPTDDQQSLIWNWRTYYWDYVADAWSAPDPPQPMDSMVNPDTTLESVLVRFESRDEEPLRYGAFGRLFRADFAAISD
ncbi:MAG TPA: VWA domain-containing protein, partial [Candidatus Hydrogenedentes bacterium]|nr:VWA domain-containing protein [Candidatus Hydrogenedentota bacterium]